MTRDEIETLKKLVAKNHRSDVIRALETMEAQKNGAAPSPFSIGSSKWPGVAKLLEEMGEVGQVCGKLIAVDGARAHWDGSDLYERLELEIGDVLAAADFLAEHNPLRVEAIEAQRRTKLALFNEWHTEQK